MKKLDDFELECILTMLGAQIAPGITMLSPADERRLRSRLRRFVLTHPAVTTKHRRTFNKAAAKDHP